MAKTVLYVLGAILAVVGLIGFVNDPVLGIFEVDTMHNLVHLVSGIIFVLVAALASGNASLTAKIFGVVYALVAVAGFVMPGTLSGIMEVNMADHVLHAGLALVLLYVGFMGEKGMSGSSGMVGGV
jgi:hypothetical protein